MSRQRHFASVPVSPTDVYLLFGIAAYTITNGRNTIVTHRQEVVYAAEKCRETSASSHRAVTVRQY
jgi:hypothetical protein